MVLVNDSARSARKTFGHEVRSAGRRHHSLESRCVGHTWGQPKGKKTRVLKRTRCSRGISGGRTGKMTAVTA